MTYTREQILSMPAGPELDRIAAEYVLGLKKTWLFVAPSQDFSDAIEILEKPEIMDKYQLGIYPTSFGKWVCRSFMPGYDITVQADTAPEAITKAAILSMMEQSGGTGE